MLFSKKKKKGRQRLLTRFWKYLTHFQTDYSMSDSSLGTLQSLLRQSGNLSRTCVSVIFLKPNSSLLETALKLEPEMMMKLVGLKNLL